MAIHLAGIELEMLFLAALALALQFPQQSIKLFGVPEGFAIFLGVATVSNSLAC
jgi:hypothetical protein